MLYYKKIKPSMTLFWIVLIVIILLILNEKTGSMEDMIRKI